LEDGYSAVFVAPGLWKARTLDLPGSDLEGVSNAVDFLSQSYNAPEEGAKLVQDKNVAIIGGGSVAMDVARVAAELGANRIYALALEGMNELPATSEELAEALADGVIIKPQSQANVILGKDGKVTGLDGVEIEWAEPGRLTPDNARVIEDTAFRMNVQSVIFAIGQTPDKAASLILARAASSGKGVEVTEETQATSIERIYAGGDIVRAAGTVVEAVGDGKRAAAAIASVLNNEGLAV
ncbi:FAD-dependent oxidoreductase, partial [Myxococcota bacterium]|nr:FAD-dependent oxidoreductase [Myxococcota bacterium]